MSHATSLATLPLLVGGALFSVGAQAGADGCRDIQSPEAKANCLVKQLRDSDEALNAAYRVRLEQLSDPDKSALRLQQRGWVRERDRDCELEGAPPEREPWLEWLERHPDRMTCVTRHAQERTAQLQLPTQGPSASPGHPPDQRLGMPALKIESAVYASPHGQSFDVTAQLRSTCAAASANCLINCGNQLAGDPDFGTPKVCRIIYVCAGREAQEVQIHEGERSMLACAPGTAGQAGRQASTADAAPPISAPSAAHGREAGAGLQNQMTPTPPHESARLQAVATVAQRWASVGNFNQAVTLLETFAAAPDTSPSDRFLANANLLRFYTQLSDHSALLRIEQAQLASEYFGTDVRTADSALIRRAGLMLQIAREELALQRFTEAAQSAAAVLQLLGDTGRIGVLAEEHTNASQIAQLAQSHQSVVPPPRPFVDRAAAAVDASMPPFSAAGAASACGIVLQHANDDTLKDLAVAWSALPDTSSGSQHPALDQLGAIDLFGDGKPVLVGIDSGELALRRADGSRVDWLQSPDQNWDEGDGGDPMLLHVAMHYYVLARDGMQLLYLSEFSRNHVERKACEFVPLPPPPSDDQDSGGKPHYEVRTPLEQLIADANSLRAYTLTRYVMIEPGIDAARAVLEASRRKDNPIPLVPEPSAYDSAGESIVVSAVKARRYDVLQFLLDHGVDPDLSDHGLRFNPQVLPDTPLAIAVKNDDLTAARILLAHGAHPEASGQRGRSNLLTQSSAIGSLSMFGLLLDAGANPNLVSPVGLVSDAVQRSLSATDLQAKIDLLLRHGADPDPWVSALFNAIAWRSGLASANERLERDGGTLPESAKYTPVHADWVEQLLASPVRARDNGLEPLLREALAIRGAPNCGPSITVIPTERLCQLHRPSPADLGAAVLARPQPTTAPLSPSPIPLTDRAAFVAYAAAQLQQRLPGFTVTMDSGYPSMLIMDARGAKVGHVNVRQMYEWCRDGAQPCQNLLSPWLEQAQTGIENLERTPDPNDLILLIGPREMFEKLAAPRAASAPPLAMRACVADLYCMLAVKEIFSPRLLDEIDLMHMHLTMDQAMQLARDHVQAQIGAISALHVPNAAEPVVFNDDTPLEGSRIALTTDWAQLAAQSGGNLIVAVPAANIVVYARGDGSQAVPTLRRFVAAVYPTVVQPVGTEILRWGANGWTVEP